MAGPVIEGIKLITHNMGGVNRPDDPAFPFRLELICRVPSFMEVAMAGIYGNEHIVVRGMTRQKLEEFCKLNRLATHPRLIKVDITQPENTVQPVLSDMENRAIVEHWPCDYCGTPLTPDNVEHHDGKSEVTAHRTCFSQVALRINELGGDWGRSGWKPKPPLP